MQRFKVVGHDWASIPDDKGPWVSFGDSECHARNEYNRGLNEGKSLTPGNVVPYSMYLSDMNKEYERGHKEGAAQANEHKHTKALLNELYHDRARLERVVSDAVDLAIAVSDHLAGEDVFDEEGSKVSVDVICGWVGQFIDTHEDA